MVTMSGTYFAARFARQRISREAAQSQRGLNSVSAAAKEFDAIAAQAKTLSDNTKEIADLTSRQIAWPTFFRCLEETTPTDVYLESVSTAIDKMNYTVIISGVAQTRKSVGAYRENLLKYRAEGEKTGRISQVVIDNITNNPTTNEQSFTLRVTMNLMPLTK